MHTKFGKNVSNRMLLNFGKCQVTACTVFELRENQLRVGDKIPPPPRLGLMMGDGCEGSELILVGITIM